jgi:DNA-binding GntR family transcriptional regulator
VNKQERAYQAIRTRILDGTYGPGYRLVIDELARELGVSAVPVREAIRRLEAESFVVYRANAGAQVAPADTVLWESEMTVLAVLEGFATALAAPELTRDDLGELEQINTRMAETMEAFDASGFSRLNRQFHFAIYERCPNPFLVDLLRDTCDRLDAIRRTVFGYIPFRGWASIEEHRDLVAMLAKGAPAAEIERAAREHKLHTVEAFRDWQEQHELVIAGEGGESGAAVAPPAPAARSSSARRATRPRTSKTRAR